jgi:hypothetical protein
VDSACGEYTVFGQVVGGWTSSRIERVSLDGETPVERLEVRTIRIGKRP